MKYTNFDIKSIYKVRHVREHNKGQDNRCDSCNKQLYDFHYEVFNPDKLKVFGWVCSELCVELFILKHKI